MAWIREKQLSRNQIVSITQAESETEAGNQIIVLVYRKKPIYPGSLPCDTVQFFEYDLSLTWDQLLQQGLSSFEQNQGIDIMGFSRTAKNLGSAHAQVLWYSREQGAHGIPSFHEIKRSDGAIKTLAEQVRDWLNAYVAPHQLLSITIHEDEHPNTNSGVVRAIITHTAGANPTRLADGPAKGTLPAGGVYTLHTFMGESNDSWTSVFDQATGKINQIGGQEGFSVTCANWSKNDGRFVAVYNWQAIYEAQLTELLRPAGCCTIF